MKPDSYRAPNPKCCGDCICSKRIWNKESELYGKLVCTFGQQATTPTKDDVVHPDGCCINYILDDFYEL